MKTITILLSICLAYNAYAFNPFKAGYGLLVDLVVKQSTTPPNYARELEPCKIPDSPSDVADVPDVNTERQPEKHSPFHGNDANNNY